MKRSKWLLQLGLLNNLSSWGYNGVKFERNILLQKSKLSYNGMAEPLCKENGPMKDIILQLRFYFWFQGLSIATACFLLLATVTLPELSFPSHIPRDNQCVKRRLLNASGLVAICRDFSFNCLHNVGNCGLPRCQPVYEMRTFQVIKGNRKVAFTQRVTVNCICAKCGR